MKMNIERLERSEYYQKSFTKILESFKGESVDIDDYHVILLFLVLSYHRILPNATQLPGNKFYHQFEDTLKKYGTNIPGILSSILPKFELSIKRLSKNGLNQIFYDINNLNLESKKEEFSQVFDFFLYQISKSFGRFGGENIQPVEITNFLLNLSDIPNNAKVFNPFAGLASFGVFLKGKQEYYGQELHPKTWALGSLRLIAYNKLESSEYKCENSISDWPDSNRKFDLIISHPPFNLRLGEYFLIEKGIQSLNPNGKLIVLLPHGFLFRGYSERQIRKELIERDLIETIISFPAGLLSYTGIPFIGLVINLKKRLPGIVKFIDANEIIKTENPREKVLDDKGLNLIVQNSFENSEKVRLISIQEIRNNEYNLNPPRYFQKNIKGTKLKSILEYVGGNRSVNPESGKLIRIRDLKDDPLDFFLDLSDVEDVEFQKNRFREISESCILLAARWKSIKPTFFQYSGTSIYLNSDILPFRINEIKADLAFLINELHADYVKEQLDGFRYGETIPNIRKDDLLEVVIKLPSLKEQKAKIQGILELSNKFKSAEKSGLFVAREQANSQYNEFASLKHTLGRPRQNILDWTDNLLDFFTKESDQFTTLNKEFLEFYGIDISSALKEVKRDINFMTEVLEKGEKGLRVEDYDKSLISLADINSLIDNLSSNGLNYKITKYLIEGEKLNERGISGDKTLFKILFDNILTNAKKYAFDENSPGNEVVFELNEIDDFLHLEIRNNGKPFPKNFDREKFITKYSTADSNLGTGLGGYDINRIALYSENKDWELVLSDPIYPVKFKFQFPIKLMS